MNSRRWSPGRDMMLLALASLSVGCSRGAGPCEVDAPLGVRSAPAAYTTGAFEQDWRAAIDSLVAAVDPSESRLGVAYHAGHGDAVAGALEDLGLTVRVVFELFPAVSFEGEVRLWPGMKEISGITGLYVGDPSGAAWRDDMCVR
jgi:hypothetical protein